ncbi:MAG TPA: glycosyltransferase family 2 protein [Acidimicrobiales bacterium]|nr:glycosyltransferase family 2 protein [Acidimicrobiales bacterium]
MTATSGSPTALGEGVSPGITVVVAAYDEEACVADVVAAVPAEVCGLGTEVLVVDDGSGDATADNAEAAGALVARMPVNVGQGAALRAGYRIAAERGARIIATTDADGQLDPRQLPALVAPILDGRADLVTGSRRLGTNHNRDAARSTGIVVFAGLLSVLTGRRVTDPSNGLRAWRREVTDTVDLRQAQYQTAELLLRATAAGFRHAEVAVTVAPRAAGETKKGSTLRYGARFTRAVLTTWWQLRHHGGGAGAGRPRG